jgi:hypothetical protein
MSLRSPTENENGEHVFDLTTVRHSRTLLAGIQAESGLDPPIKTFGGDDCGSRISRPRNFGKETRRGTKFDEALRAPFVARMQDERNPDFTSFVCFASFVVKTILSRHHRGSRFLISAINPLASKFSVMEVTIT